MDTFYTGFYEYGKYIGDSAMVYGDWTIKVDLPQATPFLGRRFAKKLWVSYTHK